MTTQVPEPATGPVTEGVRMCDAKEASRDAVCDKGHPMTVVSAVPLGPR